MTDLRDEIWAALNANLDGCADPECAACQSDVDVLVHDMDVLVPLVEAHVAAKVAKAKGEAWSEGYQDGWSDRAHPTENRFRNPYRAGAIEGGAL
jgi:hypothetical protein